MILCLVTPGSLTSDDSAEARQLLDRIREAGDAGVDLIQVRERTLGAAALLRFAQRAVEAAGGARVVVNDRVDVALGAGAAGVHLRGDSFPASRVRAIVPAGFVVGRSVHGPQEAEGVVTDGGVDYLLFGTVFPSASKPADHRPAGLDALRRVVGAVSVPVLAIGGVTPDRVPELVGAGVAGVAAIGMFGGTKRLAPLVSRLRMVV